MQSEGFYDTRYRDRCPTHFQVDPVVAGDTETTTPDVTPEWKSYHRRSLCSMWCVWCKRTPLSLLHTHCPDDRVVAAGTGKVR